MKTNRKLAELVIRDLAGDYQDLHGLSFQYPDRLTQAEAQRLADWGRGHPDIGRALVNKSDPNHAVVRLFADVVTHFLIDHPQGAGGQPSAWPERPPAGQVREDNRLLHLHPDEAEAVLAWAETKPEFHAIRADQNHPDHALLIREMLQAREIVTGTGAANQSSTESGGDQVSVAPGRTTELKAAIAELQKQPAYADPRHPDHAATVRDMTQLYERLYSPTPSDSDAGGGEPLRFARPAGSPGASQESELRVEIRQLEAHPAYRDVRHAEHASVVAGVTRAYEALYPSAPEGAAAGPGGES